MRRETVGSVYTPVMPHLRWGRQPTSLAVWFLALAILLLAPAAAAELKFRPATVKGMDLDVTLSAEGAFSGRIYEGDYLKIKFLTLNNSNTQQVKSITERLYLGGKKWKPTYETDDYNNRYAVFEVKDLIEYAANPRFRIEVKANVKTDAIMDVRGDYEMSKGFKRMEAFLRETDYIEVNDRELQSKASLEFTDTQQIELVRDIAEWVHENVTYDFDNYYEGTWSAKETYQSRRGVCDEFANLTAAFLRIKGVPTMYVSGVSFDGERFGNHGWLEVYFGGQGWLGVDSTYGEAGYLDGAHLVLAKGVDANQLATFTATTWSKKPIEVQATLHDPEVKVNGVEFFSNLLDAELETPKELGLNEPFTARARLRNRTAAHLIVPVELTVHEDFSIENASRLVWFKPFEEKALEFEGLSPPTGLEGHYAEYGHYLFLPDGNVAGTITVYPDRKDWREQAAIGVKDVSPFIDDAGLRLVIELENAGTEEGEATVAFEYGDYKDERVVEVAGKSVQETSFVARDVVPGTIVVTVKTDREQRFEIVVPEKLVAVAENGSEVKLVAGTPPREDATEAGPLEAVLGSGLGEAVASLKSEPQLLWMVIGGLTALLLLLLLKIFLGKN